MTTAAVPSEIARWRFGLPQPASVSTVPSGRTTRRIAIGSACTPPAASVAYEDARSSGETAIEPSPIAGTYAPFTSSCERTPMRRATSATFSGSTSRVSCAYTVLSERSVALRIELQP